MATTTAQEICDNSIDDDGDRLIDLNDPDCKCKGIKDSFFIPSSLIPNPSFEDYNCCPTGLAQLNCSKNWIQASNATSDYFHTCGFKDDIQRGKPPLPLPAGNGYVGFLDLETYIAFRSHYKEYIGACLTKPMQAGKDYTLSFWVGFGSRGSTWGPRAITTISIFGTSRCANLPFGDPNSTNNIRCPTYYNSGSRNWFEMSRITASGVNKWVKVNVKLRPTLPVEAITIGPECRATDGNYYFFLDELILEESAKFDSLYLGINGNPCTEDVVLSSPKSLVQRITYQWYKDGIAVPGATNPDYTIPRGEEGQYILRANDGNECELSNPYQYTVEKERTRIDTFTCRGNPVQIGGTTFSEDSLYVLSLLNHNGCDSTVEVNLKVFETAATQFDTTLCIGTDFNFHGKIYNTTGSYIVALKTNDACDSIVTLNLTIIDRYLINIERTICEGEKYQLDGQDYTLPGFYPILYTSVGGCDSIVNLNLIVNPTSRQKMDTSICSGQSISIQQKDFSLPGQYAIALKNQWNCDSLVTLNLANFPVYQKNIDTTICDQDFITVGGNVFSQAGNYQVNLLTSQGCDSTFTIQLHVNPSEMEFVDTTICEGDIFSFGNKTYDTEGNYLIQSLNRYQCDSSINLSIKVNKLTDQTVDTFICQGKALVVGNKSFDVTGQYVEVLKDNKSCDSTIRLHLLVQPNYQFTINPSICEYESYTIGNQSFNKAGKYTLSYLTQFGCDSIIDLNLDVRPKSDVKLDTSICYNDSVKIGGIVYSTEGDFILNFTNQMNCDSTVTIHISKSEPAQLQSQVNDVLCSGNNSGRVSIQIQGNHAPYQYRWSNGSTSTVLDNLQPGKYFLTISDRNGCEQYQEFDITSPPPLEWDIHTQHANCLSPETGKLFLDKLIGGKAPYQLLINGVNVPHTNGEITLPVGFHKVELVDENNCSLITNIEIIDPDRGKIELYPDSAYVTLGDTIWLEITTQDIDSVATIQWKGSGFIQCDSCLRTYVLALADAGFFEVIITDKNGCVYKEKLNFRARKGFYVPNVFSPNGDGINDYFNLISDSSVDHIDVLRIFDRWGEMVYEVSNIQPNSEVGAWDGTFRTQALNPGVFVYMILFKDKSGQLHVLKGDLSLLR